MTRVAKAHWFYLLLPFLLFAAYGAARSPAGLADPIFTERVLLVDVLVSLPLLYWLHLKSRVTARAAFIRCGAFALSGLWFVGWLLQGEGQVLSWLS